MFGFYDERGLLRNCELVWPRRGGLVDVDALGVWEARRHGGTERDKSRAGSDLEQNLGDATVARDGADSVDESFVERDTGDVQSL